MTMLSISQSLTAIGPNLTSSFLGVGGKRPYTYSVTPGGAGGSIVARTGVYTAPATVGVNPGQGYDIVTVTDSLAAMASAPILVGGPLILFCDIIQTCMGLANGRVFLWDQKIFQPTDYDPYIIVSIPSCKPFSNGTTYFTDSAGNYNEQQSVNMQAMLDINIISRGPAARDRKEEIILALNSLYSEQQ